MFINKFEFKSFENFKLKSKKISIKIQHIFLSTFLVAFFVSCASIRVESPELVDVDTVITHSDDKVFAIYQYDNEEETQKEDKYIFIRLYNPVYNNPFCPESFLGGCIKSVDVYSEKATHSAIAFDLTDSFYGLTAVGKEDLKLESCTNILSNQYMKKCNVYKSIQTTYAIKVSKQEFEKVKKMVEDYFYSGKVKYNVFQNFCIGGYGIKRRLFYSKKAKKFAARPHKFPENTFKPGKTQFVCSTFIAYVLANSVENIKQFFIENKIDSDYVLPTDLMFLPGAIKLFTSTWVDYNIAAKTYTSCNLSFAPFYPEHLVYE